jgi:MFS family permease
MSEPMPNDNSKSVNATVLWVTYLNIVLYALCYQLQRPVEPFLIKSLTEQSGDHDSVTRTYGNLQSFFNMAQMLGSPLVGILLDRIGIRYTSAIVFLSSALSYAILASAYDLHTLFLSKLPTVLQAAFLVAQATAATSTGGDAAARAAALGRMTTAYTCGATLGPALGGFLAGRGDFYIGMLYLRVSVDD